MQKRKAETAPNTLCEAFARQEKQDNLRRLQLQVQETEAKAIAARAQLQAAHGNNVNNSSAHTDTMQRSAPAQYDTQLSLPPVVHRDEQAVVLVLSDDESNGMQGALEWEDEIAAIHSLEDAISVGMSNYQPKKHVNISDVLSHSENAQPAEHVKKSTTGTAVDKENRALKPEWKKDRPWLTFRNNRMFCTACEKAGKKNVFTTGQDTFKLDRIKLHEGTEDHKMASAAPKQADALRVARANAIKLEVCDISCSLATVTLIFFLLLHQLLPFLLGTQLF